MAGMKRSALAVGLVIGALLVATLVVARRPAGAATKTSTTTLLAQLTASAEHPSGYDRSKFKLWDAQGGGCDTRDRVLIAEAIVRPTVSSSCGLSGARWHLAVDRAEQTWLRRHVRACNWPAVAKPTRPKV